MKRKDIEKTLDEGFQEEGTIEKAFEHLLEYDVRDLFEMNEWDEPKFHTLVIPFKGKKYEVEIEDDGCCEATSEHRIMYWKHTLKEIK